MPPDPFPAEQLALLFDRNTCTNLDVWLPDDAQLQQWVLVALSHSLTKVQQQHMVEVSLSCVSNEEISALNAQYRSKDSATNVLSFPADMPLLPADENETTPMLLLGDIVICPSVLETEATQQGKPLADHWAHMLIHSVLHLNGLDHKDEIAADAMEMLEIQILSSIGITNPYIAASANKS